MQYKEKYFKPINEQIVDFLRDEILKGSVKPNERLLPVVQLSKKYNVSLVTMQKAMVKLMNEGLITRSPGKGTFVAPINFQIEAGTVGIFMPALAKDDKISAFASPTHYEILTGIERYCSENRLSIKILHQNISKFDDWTIQSLHISGMLIIAPRISAYDRIEEIENAEFPLVSLNLLSPDLREEYYCVNADFYGATLETLQYLQKKGKRKTAILSCYKISEDIHPWHIIKAYQHEMEKLSLPQRLLTYDEDLSRNPEKLKKVVSELLTDLHDVDSIITTNAVEASAVVNTIQGMGKRIPEDIAVIGFFDSPEAQAGNITVMSVPISELGYKSTEKLYSLLKGNKCPKCSRCNLKFIGRKTA